MGLSLLASNRDNGTHLVYFRELFESKLFYTSFRLI